MGEVQAELGHISAAIATLQQAVEQEPEQIAPYLSLGKVLQQEGSWEKAEQIYRRALKVLPKSSESHYALGDLFLQRGQPAKARQHLERATGLNPYNGMAWSRLGQLYESAGKRKQAVRAYRQAAKWLPQDLLEWHRVEERLKVLDPPLPEGLRRGWFEFIRQMIGPVLVAVLAVLLDSGLRPWWIHWTGWLALSLATLGALLWLSGTSLPQNPVIRFFTGPGGLEDSAMRLLLAICGVLFWLLAIAVILWPVGQSLPELPF
jgi:tetratricopeptide (TPR) repeat protein